MTEANRYLLDTSALVRFSQPEVAARADTHRGRLWIAAPTIFELGFSARHASDHARIVADCAEFYAPPTTDADVRRAIEVQGLFAERGQHRALSLVDALVAAIAEARDLIVLHYDADFDLIAEVTGQRTEWIVPPGTAN